VVVANFMKRSLFFFFFEKLIVIQLAKKLSTLYFHKFGPLDCVVSEADALQTLTPFSEIHFDFNLPFIHTPSQSCVPFRLYD
jgi:hypothetical protein